MQLPIQTYLCVVRVWILIRSARDEIIESESEMRVGEMTGLYDKLMNNMWTKPD